MKKSLEWKKTYEMKCDEISQNSTFCLNFPFCTKILGIDYECIHIVRLIKGHLDPSGAWRSSLEQKKDLWNEMWWNKQNFIFLLKLSFLHYGSRHWLRVYTYRMTHLGPPWPFRGLALQSGAKKWLMKWNVMR